MTDDANFSARAPLRLVWIDASWQRPIGTSLLQQEPASLRDRRSIAGNLQKAMLDEPALDLSIAGQGIEERQLAFCQLI
jgi:hypothetical protein